MDCRTSFAMTIPGHGLPRFARNDDTGGMDCRALACPEFIEGLAVTKALFKNKPYFVTA
jgi:hypothetical protein